MSKRKIDQFYKILSETQKKIDALRAKCKHKKTYEGFYSWRIGCIERYKLCTLCDKPLEQLVPNNWGATFSDQYKNQPIVSIETIKS